MAWPHLYVGIVVSLGCASSAIAATSDASSNPPPKMVVAGQLNVTSTGAATYSIPIEVPPGTGNVAPALSLNYSSQNGNGIVGLGWTLNGLPSILRCARTLAQDNVHGGINYDSNDRFCMSGQRLVAISGSYGAKDTIYRTEVDSFTKIVSHCSSTCTSNGPDWFEVRTKAGQIIEIGNSSDSRVLAPGSQKVRMWSVSKITDSVGNYLTVIYDTSNAALGEVNPLEIRYTGNTTTTPQLTPYNTVKFVYAARADIAPYYEAGYLQKNTVLVTHIQTFLGVTPNPTTMISDYRLDYGSTGSVSTRSRLLSITRCDGTGANCLPPTSFGWEGSRDTLTLSQKSDEVVGYPQFLGDFNADGLTDVAWWSATSQSPIRYGLPDLSFTDFSPTCNPYSLFAATTGVGDINGDGFYDLFVTEQIVPGTGICLNNKDGTFSGYTSSAIGLPTFGSPTAFGDFNGDGRGDVLFGDTPYLSGGTTFSAGSGFPVLSPDGYRFTGDFDGDGCSDLLTQDGDHAIYYACSQPAQKYVLPDWAGESSAPAVYQAVIGDFNGDGKEDVLSLESNGVDCEMGHCDQSDPAHLRNCGPATLQISTATGIVDSSFSVPNSGDKLDQWCHYLVVTGDWNGDGKTDIALIADGVPGRLSPNYTTHSVWLSQGTSSSGSISFVKKLTINTGASNTANVAVADWNFDGAADLWLVGGNGSNRYVFSYVPELMTSVSNGIGETTTISYQQLNVNGAFYTKGSSATYSDQDLDAPIYVVSQIASSNGLGVCGAPQDLTNCVGSAYSYVAAHTNLRGRGFLGFETVVATDIKSGLVETTNYSTSFPYIGLVTSETKTCPLAVCTAGAVTLRSATNTFNKINLGTSTDGVTRWFALLHKSVVAGKDLDGTTLPTTTTNYTYDCDSGTSFDCTGSAPTGFGNELISVVTVSDGSSETTTNTYDNDTSNAHWYIGRLKSTTVERVVGSSDLTRQIAYVNDVGNPASTGLRLSETDEPESSPDPSLKFETDYGHDGFGNITATTEKGCVWLSSSNCSGTTPTATRVTTNTYDSATYHGQLLTNVRNALLQDQAFSYEHSVNLGYGVPSKHTDLNNLDTLFDYDTLGRKIFEQSPSGNKTYIEYDVCAALPCSDLPSTITSLPANSQFFVVAMPKDSGGTQNGPIIVTYFDSLSRMIAIDTEGFDTSASGCATSPCWIRTETKFDSHGRPDRKSRPYFLASGTPKWTVNTTYDAIDRVTLTTFPDTSTMGYCYHGLTTSTTNGNGQTKTTVRNAQAQVSKVVEEAAAACSVSGSATNYTYDAFDDLLTIADPLSNATGYTYDIRGRKTQSSDPDMGAWSYVYDGFGELYSQTDAKTQLTTLAYDGLGRPLTRAEPGLSTTWTYDPVHGVGELGSATTGPVYMRTIAYDALARPSSVTLTVDGNSRVYSLNYDANSRIQTVTHPSGLVAKYTYTTLGYLGQISDNASGLAFWTANTRDAELHLLTETAGNGVNTTQAFDPNTGRITSILAGTLNNVANQSYAYDVLGNLTSRTWLKGGAVPLKELACYDDLNRLTKTRITTGTSCTGSGAISAVYDALGNITRKTDVCDTAHCFVYGSGAGPHALTSIVGSYNGVTNPAFVYDSNGNMLSGAGRTITPTSFNMASSIVDGANSDALTYDSEHARVKQVATGATAETTYYLNDPISGSMEEMLNSGGTLTWHDFILADGKLVAERFCTGTSPCTTSPTVEYFVPDHLGSVSVITNDTGTVLQRLSYDAWGKRRNADGTADPGCTITSSTTRGFTGQEMMDSICLINFNARIQDPSLGRFLSADAVTQDVYTPQILNRYSYVTDNPLSLTDPTGNDINGNVVTLTATEDSHQVAIMNSPGYSCAGNCAMTAAEAWDAVQAAATEMMPSGASPSGVKITFDGKNITLTSVKSTDTTAGLGNGSTGLNSIDRQSSTAANTRVQNSSGAAKDTNGKLQYAQWQVIPEAIALCAENPACVRGAMALGGATAAAVLQAMSHSQSKVQSQSNEQYVIRGGYSTIENLQAGTTPILDDSKGVISVASLPGLSPNEIAMIAQLPNTMMRVSTTKDLARVGIQVVLTPSNTNLAHADLIVSWPLSPAQATAINSAFGLPVPNPGKSASGGRT